MLNVEVLQVRCLLDCSGLALTQRSSDGTCNNRAHSEWGSADVALLKTVPAAYADRVSTPVGGNPPQPSPRDISNAVVAQDDIPERRFLSGMIYAWGQILDHDLDLTTNASPAQPFNIQVPQCDEYLDPDCTGTQVIRLNRSKAMPGTSTSPQNPRQQPKEITAFIGALMVYGSDAATADKLRTHVGGLLKTSPGDQLPNNNSGYFEGCAPHIPCLPMGNDAHHVPDTESAEIDTLIVGSVRNFLMICPSRQRLFSLHGMQEAKRLAPLGGRRMTYSPPCDLECPAPGAVRGSGCRT